MKKAVLVIVLILAILGGVRGVALLKRLRHASRIQVGVDTFKLTTLGSQLSTLLRLRIRNFSASAFTIAQLQIDVLTASGTKLATQQTPLQNPLTITPNNNTQLPLAYQMSVPVLWSEIKKAGGLASVMANYLTTGTYGITFTLKGFITTEHLTIPIEKTVTV